MRQNRVTYILLLGLCGVFVVLYGERIAWVAFYAVLILPMVSFLYAAAAVRGLSAEHSVNSGHVIKNDTVVYRVRFVNVGLLPVFFARVVFFVKGDGLRPFETPDNIKIVTVRRRRGVDVEFSVVCLFRGVFLLKANVVEMLDVLGLFRFRLHVGKPVEMTVYPALSEIKNVPLSAVNASDAPSIRETADEDYAVVTDLRQYRPEDSFKRIHWKISAKKSELMIKSFQSVNLNAAVLALDNRTVPFDRPHTDMDRIAVEDKLVECVISFAHYSLMRRFPVEFYFMDNGFRRCAEGAYSGFDNIYNVCAGIGFENKPQFTQYLGELLRGRSEFINLTVFTSAIDRGLCEEIRTAKVMGHNVITVYVETRKDGGKPSLDEAVRQLLTGSGVCVYYVPFGARVGEVVG